VYDKDPKDYPGGYNHDISLIKPKDRKDIENVSTPNVRWIKKEEWRGLQKGGVEVEILGQEAQTLRNDNERSCLVCLPTLPWFEDFSLTCYRDYRLLAEAISGQRQRKRSQTNSPKQIQLNTLNLSRAVFYTVCATIGANHMDTVVSLLLPKSNNRTEPKTLV